MYYLSIFKPWFASDFMVRLLEYNPHMFKSTDDLKPSPRNFIRLLTPDETNQIKDTTKKSLKHIEDSCEWLEKSFPKCASSVTFASDTHTDVATLLRAFIPRNSRKLIRHPLTFNAWIAYFTFT